MAAPYFALHKYEHSRNDETHQNEIYDCTALVSELQIKHEELDSSDSGRDTSSGDMSRKLIAHKHTVTVKFRRLRESQAHKIYSFIKNDLKKDYKLEDGQVVEVTGRQANEFYYIVLKLPCASYAASPQQTASNVTKLKVYTATINYGSQRYNRMEDDIYYDGMTITCVEL